MPPKKFWTRTPPPGNVQTPICSRVVMGEQNAKIWKISEFSTVFYRSKSTILIPHDRQGQHKTTIHKIKNRIFKYCTPNGTQVMIFDHKTKKNSNYNPFFFKKNKNFECFNQKAPSTIWVHITFNSSKFMFSSMTTSIFKWKHHVLSNPACWSSNFITTAKLARNHPLSWSFFF